MRTNIDIEDALMDAALRAGPYKTQEGCGGSGSAIRGPASAAKDELKRLLGHGAVELRVPDQVLFELLRGFRLEREFLQAGQRLLGLKILHA